MPIHMITGLPGNAKTLHAISFVKEWAERESRPVFYSGIKQCTIPGWLEFDPLKWMDCPTGAIIFIDEAQKTFRNRSLGTIPPLHVTELEEHRHRGVDFVMITQHPTLIDPSVRKLTQTHRHMVRIFGMEASTVHKWDAVRDNCDKPAARKDSEKTRWKFDKSLYGCYHSADQHTIKRSIPLRAKLLLLVPVLLAAAAYTVSQRVKPKTQQSPTLAASPGASAYVPSVPLAATARDPVADAKAYVYENTPRVLGLPHTAPRYDELTKPVRVPVPAACVAVGSLQSEKGLRCRCYSQQGTPMQVTYEMCLDIAKNGFFEDFDSERGGPRGAPPVQASQQVAPVQTASALQVASLSLGAPTVVIPDINEARSSSRGGALPPVARR